MILEIDGEHSGIRFSACHFIPRHEKCSRLHGHTYILRLRLEGDIGDEGMVMDFVELKKELRKFRDELDHKTLLPGRSDEVILTVGEKSVNVVCGNKDIPCFCLATGIVQFGGCLVVGVNLHR